MRASGAIAAGAIGTGVVTSLWLVEPSVGLPKIAVGQMLSTFMSVYGKVVGWIYALPQSVRTTPELRPG